jgi:hypothetical protein
MRLRPNGRLEHTSLEIWEAGWHSINALMLAWCGWAHYVSPVWYPDATLPDTPEWKDWQC